MKKVMEDDVFNKELEKLYSALIKHFQRFPPFSVNDAWWYTFGYMFSTYIGYEKERIYTTGQIVRIKKFAEEVYNDFRTNEREALKNVHT